MKRIVKPVLMAVLATSLIATSAMPAFAKAYNYDEEIDVDLGSYIAGEKSSVFLELDMDKATLVKGEIIKIKFPQEWKIPKKIDEEDVEINGEEVKDVSVSGRTVKIEIPKDVHGDDELEIEFLKDAGLSNPTDADDDYVIEVSLRVQEEHKEKKVIKVPKPTTPTTPPVVPTKPVDPAVPPVAPTKPVDPAVPPVAPTKPVDPIVPPVAPTKPVDPIVPPVAPTKPVDPIVPPVEPTKPVDPTVPPVEPTKPVDPIVPPVEPTKPVDPIVPPVAPAKLVVTTTPPVEYETITEEVTVKKMVEREYESDEIEIKKTTSKKSDSTSVKVPTLVTKKLEVSLQVGSTNGTQLFTENGIGSNNVVLLDTAPFIQSGTTLVPLRFIADGLGVPIVYDNNTQVATLTLNEKTVKLSAGSKTAKIDEQTVNLPVAPQIVNNRMMVPLRFIAENLGAQVVWDGFTQKININKVSTHSR
ncbi:stalk domain-containing protein [Brevibacillus sp. NPDC058079]|uniref:stalk domain-containing protein n=1 Tax=Brevibacillus sp. NPDC058079 TaxID=3346330 RepID=UPI0036EB8D15